MSMPRRCIVRFCQTVSALLLAPSLAVATPFFAVDVNCETLGSSSGALPVSISTSCGSAASAFASSARASFGSLGVESSAATFVFQGAGFTKAGATFDDMVVFSNPDPNAPNLFPFSMNVGLGGILNAETGSDSGSGGDAIFRFMVDLGVGNTGIFRGLAAFKTSTGFELDLDGFTGGGFIVPGPVAFQGVLTSPIVQGQLGPTNLHLRVESEAFARRTGGLALSDFANTFEFVTGTPVFNLPDGYTANAGNWLVNNRFVGQVPEPSMGRLLGVGLLALMVAGTARVCHRAASSKHSAASRSLGGLS